MRQDAGYRSLNRPAEVWRSEGFVAYPDAMARMAAHVDALQAGQASDVLWFLEHPSLYTAGVSAKAEDLLAPERFPVFRSGRGGQYTYHGPGQRVAYVMVDLRERGRDVRAHVCALERWIIAALSSLGVVSGVRDNRVGVWVDRGGGREDKIAAIGVKVSRWATWHGVAINVAPELSHFSGIVPCGLRQFGVTSLADLGVGATMSDLDDALLTAAFDIFGPLTTT